MHVTPSQVVVASWLVFALYWLVAALGVKRTAKRQNPSERMLYVVFMAAGFFLLYQENPNWGPLNHRFLPDKLWIAWLGSALCAAGVLFAIWARRTIGKDWSAEVQIKEGHQLIRSGPYTRIRHPIYTGILLATLGRPGHWRISRSPRRAHVPGRFHPQSPQGRIVPGRRIRPRVRRTPPPRRVLFTPHFLRKRGFFQPAPRVSPSICWCFRLQLRWNSLRGRLSVPSSSYSSGRVVAH
jgi:protein-S-isoprenylcysteine O-methyltransferase Ste14